MDQHVHESLALIRHKIKKLQQAEATLIEEFGGPDFSDTSAVMVSGNRTRKTQLMNFLVTHGPSKRAKIIAESGMPKGSIAFLLNQPEFTRDADGKWSVIPPHSSATQETTQ